VPGGTAPLYERDFCRWTEEQAVALREAAALGTNLPLDWENLAEEIDSLGRSQLRELRTRIALIIEHLLKLEYSPAAAPRRGWMETVGRERSDIELLLADSPSLGRETDRMIAEETARAGRHIVEALRRHGEATPDVVAKIATATYLRDQVLGDWFPGDPPRAASGARG
jgi:hypothetical protein